VALTFNTGQTLIANADAVTNFAFYRASGTGGAGSLLLSTDFFRQGTASVAYRVQANWEAGILYDYFTANGSTVLDMSPTGRHLYMWFNHLNVAFLDTDLNNGVYVIATSDTGTSGTPTNYARWVIGGGTGSSSNELTYQGGWQLVVLDMTNSPTNNVGTGANIASIRRLGIGISSITGSVKTENLYLDALWYGKALYEIIGDGANTATWSSVVANSAAQSNGLFEDIGGAVKVACGIQFGNSVQANTTTFSDSSATILLWKEHFYLSNANATVHSIDYANLYTVTAQGNSSAKTDIVLGTVVGTGDDRQGVLGGAIVSPDTTNITWDIDFSTHKANLSNVRLYGVSMTGATKGVILDNNSGAASNIANGETSIISTSFINCGEVDPGTTGNGAEMLNFTIIDPLGGTATNRGLRLHELNNIKKGNFITSGNPAIQHIAHLTDAGAYDISFVGLIYFGDYSSANLWHGEISTANANVTINASSGANPSAAEFDLTGAGSAVSVSNPVTLTVTGLVGDSEFRIFQKESNEELAGTDSSGTSFSYPYNYDAPNANVWVVVLHTDYLYQRFAYVLAATDQNLLIQYATDRVYSNP